MAVVSRGLSVCISGLWLEPFCTVETFPAVKVYAFDDCAGKVGVGQVGPCEVRVREFGMGEVCPGCVGIDELGVLQAVEVEIGFAQPCIAEVTAVHFDPRRNQIFADVGKTQVISAKPPFDTIAVLDTGPITNHVNFARNANGQFAYVTIGRLNEIKVFTTEDKPSLVATIPTGPLPHGIWPSGDGTRIYAGLENGNAVTAIDTVSNKVVATIQTGQSPQGMTYIPNDVPTGSGTDNLSPIDTSGDAVHLSLGAVGAPAAQTSVTVNNQGLIDLVQAAVTCLEPKKPYVLALSGEGNGSGALEPLSQFMTNPAGAAIVVAVGPLRSAVTSGSEAAPRRYLVIAPVTDGKHGTPVQIQR